MHSRSHLKICVFAAVFAFSAPVSAAITTISSIDDFQKIGKENSHPLGGDYELGGDIDASSTRQKGFAPVGSYDKPFTGKFDGKGHAVRNLYIDSPSKGHVGLFGYVGAAGRVSNLGVVDADISGSFAVGTLAGTNNGSITLCYSSGAVEGLRQESNAGGLVGVNGGTIEKSYSSASVKGKEQLGGLAGFLTVNPHGSISESYATGSVSGSKAVGGLVGYVFGGSIGKSFSMGKVDAKSGAGGLVGIEFRSANPQYNVVGQTGSGAPVKAAQIVNCFWDIDASGVSASSGGGSGKTSQEMRQRSTYENAGWDLSGNDAWEMTENQQFPQIKSTTIPEYDIIYKASFNGSLRMSGTSGTESEYQLKLSAYLITPTITAVPNAGYKFSHWSDGKSETSRRDTATTHKSFTAYFVADNTNPSDTARPPVVDPPGTPKTYILAYSAGDNGKLTVNNGAAKHAAYSDTLPEGRNGPTITAVADEGYRFQRWSDGETTAERSDAATKNVEVRATFTQISTDPSGGGDTDPPKTYTLNYETLGNGWLTVNNATITHTEYTQVLDEGQNGPTITAVAENGHRFVDWSDGVTTAARRDPATKNLDVFARFSPITNPPNGTDPTDPTGGTDVNYTLSYEAVGNGKLIVNNGADKVISYDTTVISGAAGPIIAPVPNTGYRFLNWSDNYPDSARKDVANKNITAFARFAQLTTPPNGGNPTDPSDPGTPITPKKYTFYYEAIGSGKLTRDDSSSNQYQIVEIENINEGSAGPKITAVPNDGFFFVRWSDGVTDKVRKDVAEKNINVFARFGAGAGSDEPDPATMSYRRIYKVDGNNGWIKITAEDGTERTMPQFDTTLFYGEKTTFRVTAVPSTNYAFLKWNDDIYNPTIQNEIVSSDVVYEATFVPLRSLTYVAEGNGKVKWTADSVGHGRLELWAASGSPGKEVIAEADTGYYFSGWSDGFPNNTRADMVKEENQMFTATFSQTYTLIYKVQNPIDTIRSEGNITRYDTTIIGGLRVSGVSELKQYYEIHVPLGSDGTEITAAFDNDNDTTPKGYKFIGWSDGNPNKKRRDTPTATSQKTFTAIFEVWDYEPIYEYEDLRKISVNNNSNTEYLSKNYELMNDIEAAISKKDGFDFTPIGNATTKFTGKFRGNGHTIKDLYINRPSYDYAGLFGYTDNAEIRNVRLESAEITGKYNVGGLVGRADNTTIDNCGAGGTVKGNSSVGGLVGYYLGDGADGVKILTNSYSTADVGSNPGATENFGGLVGYAQNALVKNCHTKGTVTVTGSNVGGVIGAFAVPYTIEQCYSNSTINVTAGSNVGGLVGASASGGNSIAAITECYASGTIDVAGSGSSIGGLVGVDIGALYYNNINMTINSSYAIGNVNAPSSNRVGGFVGGYGSSPYAYLTIINCYSAGKVAGNSEVGGFFIGGGGVTTPTVTNCYFDSKTSGQSDNYATDKTTEEMHQAATYEGWDFSNTWAIAEGSGYPYLRSLGVTQYPLVKERVFVSRVQSPTVPRVQIRGKTLLISASSGSQLQVRFYDLRGRMIARYAAVGNARIPIGRIPSGRYILELREAAGAGKGGKRLSLSRVSVR